jgi:hypothetical protein
VPRGFNHTESQGDVGNARSGADVMCQLSG